jgi:hypothetical protein
LQAVSCFSRKAETAKVPLREWIEDNRVLDYFRSIVEAAGGGSYQTLINDALHAHIQQKSILEAVRQVVREELAGTATVRQKPRRQRQVRARRAETFE